MTRGLLAVGLFMVVILGALRVHAQTTTPRYGWPFTSDLNVNNLIRAIEAQMNRGHSLHPAGSGDIQFGNDDLFCWRNSTNTADLCLSMNGNTLVWPSTVSFNGAPPGSASQTTDLKQLLVNLGFYSSTVQPTPLNLNAGTITAGSFTSGTANPAFFGQVRLANGDVACWRNAANSADYCITLNSSNQFVIGSGTAPIVAPAFISATSNPAQAGTVRMANFLDSIACRNAANSADLTVLTCNASNQEVLNQPLNITVPVASYNGLTPVANSFPVEIYNTAPAAGTSSIPATTMVASTPAQGNYEFSFYLTQTALGTSCTTSTTVLINTIFTDPNVSSVSTFATASYTITTNGAVGFVAPTAGNFPVFPFRAKASTAIQFSTTYTAGSGCSPAPAVQVFPVLKAL